MRIKSYKDLVGLSIAQARGAFENYLSENDYNYRCLQERLQDKYEVLIGTIVDVSAQRDTAQAEVDRLTKVIASYDSPEVETAKSFIKAFNIDVDKYVTKSEIDEKALQALKQAQMEGVSKMPSVTSEQAYAQARRVLDGPPSTASLESVWRAVHDTRHGRPAARSKWTRRRLTQLNRLKELGHATEAEDGSWWPTESGPKPDET